MEDDDEPELWVLDDDEDELADSPAPGDAGPALTSTLTSDDVAGADWADTSWLDDLAPAPADLVGPDDEATDGNGTVTTDDDAGWRPDSVGAPPIDPGWSADTAAPDRGPRPRGPSTPADEFASLSQPTPGDDGAASSSTPPPTPPPGSVGAATPDQVGGTDGADEQAGDDDSPRSRRRAPTRNAEVSEFLRELSRLALDDD